MDNPFKFGTVVSEPFFFDRIEERETVKSVLSSSNHLILISPRRYGKTSLVMKVVSELARPYIYLDLQMINSVSDFAAELLKRILKIHKYEKIKSYFRHFRIIPTLNLNPMTNEFNISFQPQKSDEIILDDVLNLLENTTKSNKKVICILDEFQVITRINENLLRTLRATMQHHKNINYVLLGSQESMMREIFEKKKSPFYHFGYFLNLNKISAEDFSNFLEHHFSKLSEKSAEITKNILEITDCHPYYTQQLAFSVWELLQKKVAPEEVCDFAVKNIIHTHDYDFERIWNNFNLTDRKILTYLKQKRLQMLNMNVISELGLSSSTIYSSLKRLQYAGFVIRSSEYYEIDDPFFRLWIKQKRAII